MSKTADTICVGGSTSSSVSGTTFNNGSKSRTCHDNCENQWTDGPYSITYSPSSWWEPPIPGSFPDCGTFTYTAKVKGISNDSDCPDDTGVAMVGTFTVTVISAEVKSVTFSSDHRVLTDYNTDYAGNGGTVYSPRGWRKSPAANNPVTHTKGLNVGVTVVINVCPSGLTFDLAGTSGSSPLTFHKTGITSTGSDQSIALTSDAVLPTKVDVLNQSIAWKVTANSKECDAGSSGPHKVYVLWDSPATTTPTLKRINWVCGLAQGKTSLAAIGDAIGPDATGNPRFGANSIFGQDSMPTAWQVMDGVKADCGTLSTLMKYELDIIGATGAAVKFVHACHNNWTPLVSDIPSLSSMEHRVGGNDNTILGFISGGWNNYEGCCLFLGKYWMGGAGSAHTKAVDVLHHWVDPNTSAAGNHQCYLDQQNQVATYAPPPEPTY